MVGTSDAMDDLRREIERVAALDITVLLRGETGTGKELAARAIIAAGGRANRPALSLNMGATVPSTAASELFGHERGAFTGAATSTVGLFAAADGGSLFLDEIGLTPTDVQPMLLRALETSEIRALGSTRTRKVDVRFIAATDTDLERAMAAGTFSPALFQRLARYQITLPSLRARREDFGILLLHFLRRAFAKHGQPDPLGSHSGDGAPWLSASAVTALASHRWAGNIRELENVAGEIVIANLGQDEATLPPSVQARLTSDSHAAAAQPVPVPVAPARAGLPSPDEVAAALARNDGNATRAAAALRVSRTTFFELRKRHPSMRSISAINDEELLSCREACDADPARMAARLGVPLKALKDRLARLPGIRRPS
jgi:two-component system nitrogen regulation response regulator GlnG